MNGLHDEKYFLLKQHRHCIHVLLRLGNRMPRLAGAAAFSGQAKDRRKLVETVGSQLTERFQIAKIRVEFFLPLRAASCGFVEKHLLATYS